MPILIPLAIAALAAMASKKKPGAMVPDSGAKPGSRATGERFDLNASSVRSYIDELARGLGVEPAALRSVIRVESSGKPYGPDGKMLLRFEPHVFARLTEKAGKRAVVMNPGMKTLDKPRQRTGGQAGEYETLQRAMAVDPELALRSASFGLPQVMGFNFKALGYPSARAMYEAFSRSPQEQLRGMVSFIASAPKALAALKQKNWPSFVAVYNGSKPGSKENSAYSAKLQQHYHSEQGRTAMSGFHVRTMPFRTPPGRRLVSATRRDRRRLIRAARHRQLAAWMHSPELREAQQANVWLAKGLGWRTRAGSISGPGDKDLAIMVYRLQQVAGLTPNGRLDRSVSAFLQRHIAKGSRIGRWATSVLVLPGVARLSGLGGSVTEAVRKKLKQRAAAQRAQLKAKLKPKLMAFIRDPAAVERAQKGNVESARRLGWKVKRTAPGRLGRYLAMFKGDPASPRLAAEIFWRQLFLPHVMANGILGEPELYRMARIPGMKRWALKVFDLPARALSGMGAFPSAAAAGSAAPAAAPGARPRPKREEGGFFSRVASGALQKLQDDERAGAERRALRDRMSERAQEIELLKAKRAAAMPMPAGMPRPGLYMRPGPRFEHKQPSYLPWLIGGGALLVGVLLANTARRNPAPASTLLAA